VKKLVSSLCFLKRDSLRYAWVSRKIPHPRYIKLMNKSQKHAAHDEVGAVQVASKLTHSSKPFYPSSETVLPIK
jgi:hypothetical protein